MSPIFIYNFQLCDNNSIVHPASEHERNDLMHIRKIMTKTAAALLSAALAGLFTTAGYYSARLPDSLTSSFGEELKIAQYPEIKLCFGNVGGDDTATLSLFGAIPIKNIEVRQADAPVFLAGGSPFGIKLLMEGVMVTGLGDVKTESGNAVCPAADAGLKTGDIVCSANGKPLTSNLQLQAIITRSGGSPIPLSVQRDGDSFDTVLKPVFSDKTERWTGGMWVRDSIAGIGTMTFIDKSTGRFAGLGHPICDSDTGGMVPLHSGEAVPVDITDTKRGGRGIPGELHGRFNSGGSFGTLDTNTDCGIFGQLSDGSIERFAADGEEFRLGYRQDISIGEAQVYTTVSGDKPQKYDILIEKIDYNSEDASKNMMIKITDPQLLEASGGIVQGMSGSPIIQNGRLIGAVTHVFVADPSRGFAVFAENMAQHINECEYGTEDK